MGFQGLRRVRKNAEPLQQTVCHARDSSLKNLKTHDSKLITLESLSGPSSTLPQAGDEVVREPVGDFLRARGTVRAVPPRNPVDGAENREREELRVSLGERAGPDAFLEHLPHAAIEPV